jgi:hypothetical protein
MQAESDGVPSPLDHQALCLVIAILRDFPQRTGTFPKKRGFSPYSGHIVV